MRRARLAAALLCTALPQSLALFGWGESSGAAPARPPAKSDSFGCVAWRGDNGADLACKTRVAPTLAGACECAWGKLDAAAAGHERLTCAVECAENFPEGETGPDESWIAGSKWNWNDWRDVEFRRGGEFWAPTPECEAGACVWAALNGNVYILWGDSGLHTVAIAADKQGLRGMRFDGDPCHARFVSAGPDPQRDGSGDTIGDDEDLYELLGVDAEADDADVKKAFRKLSRDLHPDRVMHNGKEAEAAATAQFNRVRAAYEVLGDPDSRILYDTGGMEAVQKFVAAGGRDGDAQAQQRGRDPFAAFFGGGHGGHGRGGGMRSPDSEYRLEVSLEDLYTGAELRTQITRRVVCRGCARVTAKNRERCSGCGACPAEVRLVNRQMGGFIVQQEERVPSKERCREEPTELVAVIERGADTGERLVFERRAEQTPGKIPGDIILQVHAQPHARFTREGNDLKTTVHVPLKSALTGFSHAFSHLDGHEVRADSRGGEEVIAPFSTRVLPGEGMPVHGVPSQRGDMIIEFQVQFPDAISETQRQRLRDVL